MGRAGAANEADRTDNHGHWRTTKPGVSRLPASAELRTVVPSRDNSSMPPVWYRGGQQQGPGSRPGAFAAVQPQPSRRLNVHATAWCPDHPEMATRHNELGIVLWNLGYLAGAPTHLERALEIGEATLDPDHPAIAHHSPQPRRCCAGGW